VHLGCCPPERRHARNAITHTRRQHLMLKREKGKQHSCSDFVDEGTEVILALGKAEGWARCPGCRTMIELNLVCYHMTCVCKVGGMTFPTIYEYPVVTNVNLGDAVMFEKLVKTAAFFITNSRPSRRAQNGEAGATRFLICQICPRS
jgi:hypothetical protein